MGNTRNKRPMIYYSKRNKLTKPKKQTTANIMNYHCLEMNEQSLFKYVTSNYKMISKNQGDIFSVFNMETNFKGMRGPDKKHSHLLYDLALRK